MGGLTVASLALLIFAHILQKKLDVAQAQMQAIQTRTDAAVTEKQANERKMRQPANAAVLERAHFLNTLFLRKSFSWTAVMMDLETVLPSGVQVTSIEPGVTADGDVIIRMRVAGDRDRAVQLVRNLEHSKRFLQPRLSSEAVQAKDLAQANAAVGTAAAGNVEFEILANYNPLPEGESYPKVKPAADETMHPGLPANHVAGSAAAVTLKPMAPMQPRQPMHAQPPRLQSPPPQLTKPVQNGRSL